MRHYILVRETRVIEIIDDGLEIIIIDLINKIYINIDNVLTINSAIRKLEDLNVAHKIKRNHLADVLDELGI